MDKFEGTKADITLKNHHKWVCPVYVLDSIFHGNISEPLKWEPYSRAGTYLGQKPFYAGSLALVLNQ